MMQSNSTQTMKTQLVLNMLGRLLGLFAFLSLGCAAFALTNDRYQQASLFILVVMISFVSSAVLFVTAPSGKGSAGMRETVVFLLAAWFSLSFLGALPFLMVAKGDFILALFESVSCSTTTGSTLLDPDTPLSASLIAWRGVLHMFGATLAITGTLVLLAMSGRNTVGIYQTKARNIGLSLGFTSFSKLFFLVGLTLISLACVSYTALLADGLSLREAYALSVGAATTGEILPYEVGAMVATQWTGLLLSVILILASLNTGLLLSFSRSPRQIFTDRETIGILFAFCAMAALLFLFETDFSVMPAISEAASVISTSGLMVPDHRQVEISIPLMIFFGFLGGSAISATGGVKMFRMRALLSRTGYEFARLAHPKSVIDFDLGGNKKANVTAMMSVWVYLVGFASVAALLASYLAILGLDFDSAMLVAVGAITNSAALFRTELLGDLHASMTQIILTFSMIFGRLELLLLLSLVIRT